MIYILIPVIIAAVLLFYNYMYGKGIKAYILTRIIKYHQKVHKSKIIIIVDEDMKIPCNHIISIDNCQRFIQKLRSCHKHQKKLEIIIHSSGGTIESSDIIVNAILEHHLPIQCYVPRFANSAATFIALSTDKIHMDNYAHLSPTDPQITIEMGDGDKEDERTYSSKVLMDYLKYVDNHESYEIKEGLFLDAKEAEQLHQDNIQSLDKILEKKGKRTRNNDTIFNRFCSGDFPHHTPLYYTELRKMGMHVELNIPSHINQIFRCFEKYFII